MDSESSTFFPTPKDFKRWLDEHHKTETKLWVGYYKKATKLPSITWPESVDQALCYGWIDGIRKRIDDNSYMIRFTPRKTTSIWSAVNIARVAELSKEGLMQPAGTSAYEKRSEKKSERYSYEQKNVTLAPKYEKQIKSNAKAWDFFSQKLAPSSRTQSIWWVMSAKKEETQLRRLSILIESSEKGNKIPPLGYGVK